jgi:chromosome partitioning protein
MSIIAVAHVKGGVGKTSIATALAIHLSGKGRDVLLVDSDPQETASDFTAVRTEKLGDPGYTAVKLREKAVRDQVRRLAPKHTDVVIDVGAQDSAALRSTLLVSDIVLVPIFPGSFDLWSTDRMATLVREAAVVNETMRSMMFLCRADALGADNKAMADALSETDGMTFIDAPLVTRKAWRNAQAEGRAIWELLRPDAKAVAEFNNLVRAAGV